jgi:peptidyl-Lys metalloendopeptidase
VSADGYVNCTPEEGRVVAQALDAAKELTVSAAAAVADTPDYARWFGDYSRRNAEKVRANLKGIVSAIRRGSVTVQCDQIEPDGCAAGEYAYVYSDRPYHLHICPSFFDLPSMANLRPGARRSDFGTREGTIVHEISHFTHVADTDDHCYSRRDCALMAARDPGRAIENADSYQYFTEDVAYYARQPLGDKPPPAPSPRL